MRAEVIITDAVGRSVTVDGDLIEHAIGRQAGKCKSLQEGRPQPEGSMDMDTPLAFDAFVEKWSLFGKGTADHRSKPLGDQIRAVDAEIAAMERDRQQVTSWDAVPIGARVFVRWGGGNRGRYLRHEDGLGPCPETPSTYRHSLPALGPHRMDARAWVEDVDSR